jgi:hypothetical protein
MGYIKIFYMNCIYTWMPLMYECPLTNKIGNGVRHNVRCNLTVVFAMSFVIHSAVVLRQVHSLFQSEFSTERDLALPVSVSSILSFP